MFSTGSKVAGFVVSSSPFVSSSCFAFAAAASLVHKARDDTNFCTGGGKSPLKPGERDAVGDLHAVQRKRDRTGCASRTAPTSAAPIRHLPQVKHTAQHVDGRRPPTATNQIDGAPEPVAQIDGAKTRHYSDPSSDLRDNSIALARTSPLPGTNANEDPVT